MCVEVWRQQRSGAPALHHLITCRLLNPGLPTTPAPGYSVTHSDHSVSVSFEILCLLVLFCFFFPFRANARLSGSPYRKPWHYSAMFPAYLPASLALAPVYHPCKLSLQLLHLGSQDSSVTSVRLTQVSNRPEQSLH